MNKRILIFLLVAFCACKGLAQQIVIEGVIKDSDQNEPLAYANIFLKNTPIGTVSNTNGAFRLIVSPKFIDDTLVISYLGYETQIFQISKIEEPLKIGLQQDQAVLEQVVVVGYTAQSIINKALERIPHNYFETPYQSTGFYRVTSQKNQSYIHLSEAVFDIYHSKTGGSRQQFKLEKMRAIKDERASQGIELGLKPSGIFEFDIVNNPDGLELLTKKGLKQHTFKIEGIEQFNGREVYNISFDQINNKKPGYKGFMLIDKNSFAFVYFDFGLSPKGLAYFKFGDPALRALMKIVGINISMNRNNYQIQYKKIGDRYYLNTVGNDATLNFKSDRDYYNFDADTRVDYLVTEFEFENVAPFEKEEALGQGKLIEEQNSNYDQSFWDNYTIILPTSDFGEIARRLEANNKANDLKLQIEDRLHKLPKDKALRVDSILNFYNDKNLFNGNALITFEGETLLQKSYNSSLTNNQANSQFRIGSLAKTFTAMIIAQYEQAGLLDYNDQISKFLPDYSNGAITIHQLLSHQSGIPDFIDKREYLPQILNNTYTIMEVATQFCSDSLEFEPGSKFEYSNSNFLLLSAIAESIEKKPYSKILDQRIFVPLNMDSTFFGAPKSSNNLVTAYLYEKPEPQYPIQNVGGAGGISTTVSDLLKWSKSLDNNTILPKAKIQELLTPRAEYTDWDAHYGYGWMIDRYMFSNSKKHKIFYHPGTDFGFYSMFVKQPDAGITIILLNNTGEFPRFEITDLILNELN